MTEKITAGILLAFMGWEDFRGKTVAVWKILLFLTGSLICAAVKTKGIPGEVWSTAQDAPSFALRKDLRLGSWQCRWNDRVDLRNLPGILAGSQRIVRCFHIGGTGCRFFTDSAEEGQEV